MATVGMLEMILSFQSPTSAEPIVITATDGWARCRSGEKFPWRGRVLELMQPTTLTQDTSQHYSRQWGKKTGFLSFLNEHNDARSVMPSYQLPWPRLIADIRNRSSSEPVLVCDAACGYGGILVDLFAEAVPSQLVYLGADIHGSLADIPLPRGAEDRIFLVRWDISLPMPVMERFDYVLCRNAIHHTPDPAVTFKSLASLLKPGGTIAISAYARKTPMREAVDDALRAAIAPMTSDQALAVAREFTQLGQDLQHSDGQITLTCDLPFLGLEKGRYSIHEFLYYSFIKCWYNSKFGMEYSDIVNFDWYHPPYAYRYSLDELAAMVRGHGLEVTATASMPAQHYVEAVKP